MGDIEYLSIKSFGGKMRDPTDANPTIAEGSTVLVGTLASITANTGKDLYLAGASITSTGATTSNPFIVELQAEFSTGVFTPLETFRSNVALSTSNTFDSTYHFEIRGVKVTTGLLLRLEITSISGIGTTIAGTIFGFDEATGATPAV